MKLVLEDRKFTFKKLCPYCAADLTYIPNGWEEDSDGRWMVDSFDVECHSEPKVLGGKKWEEWLRQHSEMPYVHQLPVDEKVKEYINKSYRFVMK